MTKVNRKTKNVNKLNGLNNVDMLLLSNVYYEFSTYTPALDCYPTKEFDKVLFPKYSKISDEKLIRNLEGRLEKVSSVRERVVNNLTAELRSQSTYWTFVVQLFHLSDDGDDLSCDSYVAEVNQQYRLFCNDQKRVLLEAMKDALKLADVKSLVAMNTVMFPTGTKDINDNVIDSLVDIAVSRGVMNRWYMNEKFKEHCIAHYPEISEVYINNDDVSKLGQYIKELHMSEEYEAAVIRTKEI